MGVKGKERGEEGREKKRRGRQRREEERRGGGSSSDAMGRKKRKVGAYGKTDVKIILIETATHETIVY